jgi:hypothetical protein
MSHFPACSNKQIRQSMLQSAKQTIAGLTETCTNAVQYAGWANGNGLIQAKDAYDLLSVSGCDDQVGMPLGTGLGGCAELMPYSSPVESSSPSYSSPVESSSPSSSVSTEEASSSPSSSVSDEEAASASIEAPSSSPVEAPSASASSSPRKLLKCVFLWTEILLLGTFLI